MRSRNCNPRFVYFFAIDHQAQVGLDQFRLGHLGHALAVLDLVHRLAKNAFRQLGLFLDLLDLLLRGGDDPRHLLDLDRANAKFFGDRPLSQGRRADLEERLAEFLQRQARPVLAGDDLSICLLDALDEVLELEDDLVDLLLVESQVLESLQDLLLELDVLVSALLLGGLRDLRVQLPADHLVLFPEPADLVYDLADTLDVPLLVERGILLVGILDDLLDADLLLTQLVAQVENLLNRDRGVQHHLQDAPLAFLHALGDLDLALARE
jgi:hypothetical protein